MSITDELREESRGIQTFTCMTEQAEQLLAIADRIDAEHERQLEVLYRDMSDAEYVKLPVDADGVPIHLGDEVYQVEGGWVYTVKSITFYPENTTVSFECKHGFGCDSAHRLRHYYGPTVESVLREFADAMSETHPMDVAARIAEYAAKLRLADDGKEQ